MTLPNLLLTEARRGFQTCAKQYRARRQQSQTFRTLQPLLKKRNSRSAREVAPPPRLEVTKTNEALATRVPPQSDPDHVPTEESGSSRELITKPSKPSSVSEIKRADVPMKIIPKAQITPELTLTPKERLQIEFLTRRPPRAEEKKIFREKLLIYHGGTFRTNFLSIVKVSSALVMFGFTCVVVPAYYAFGSPWWTVALLFVAGLTPFTLITYTSRPFVTWIHLTLPIFARQSAKAALEYSRNLPENAMLQITFMRSTALPATVEASIADLVPAQSLWRPVTFQWAGERVNRGSFLRPNPTAFYVRPNTGTGKEARDTIPGIWENVYKRIAGIESKAVEKWRK